MKRLGELVFDKILHFKFKDTKCFYFYFYRVTMRARLCSMTSPTLTTFLDVSTWPSLLQLAGLEMNFKSIFKQERPYCSFINLCHCLLSFNITNQNQNTSVPVSFLLLSTQWCMVQLEFTVQLINYADQNNI